MKKITVLLCLLPVFLFLFGMPLLSLATDDAAYVVSERRAAAERPVFSLASLADGRFAASLESYLLDNLPFREAFRKLKNRFSRQALRLSDVDGLFLCENGVARDLSPVNTALVQKNAAFFDSLIQAYFPESERVYLSLIPDKAYYARPVGERLDFDALHALLEESMKAPHTDIALADTLSLSSYFATDIHLTQAGWFAPLARLGEAMAFNAPLCDDFETQSLGRFVGTLGLQAALSDDQDEMTLFYDRNGAIASAEVHYPDGTLGTLYDRNAYETSDDKYDVFLRGETVGEGKRQGNFFIKIQNPKAASPRRLILFRDSFARAALPLLLSAYSEILVVDLRAPSLFYGDNASLLFDDGNTDILFLVSVHTLNTTAFR